MLFANFTYHHDSIHEIWTQFYVLSELKDKRSSVVIEMYAYEFVLEEFLFVSKHMTFSVTIFLFGDRLYSI